MVSKFGNLLRKIFQAQYAYAYYLGAILLINILPLLAPILLKLSEIPGLEFLKIPARGIYLVFSFTCHQFAHRSLGVADYQCAWCARDMGIWSGILLGALAARNPNVGALKWYWLIPFVIPILLDGGIQTLETIPRVGPNGELVSSPEYISTNPARYLTGGILGIGISLFVSPYIRAAAFTQVKHSVYKGLGGVWTLIFRTQSLLVGVLLILLSLSYLILVSVWGLTSQNFKPTDFLDSQVKTPIGDIFVRREFGDCSTDSKNLFGFNCAE